MTTTLPTDGLLLQRVRVVGSGNGHVVDVALTRDSRGEAMIAGISPAAREAAVPSGSDLAHLDLTCLDLAGRWVMPGLWDAHTHMTQWALTRRRLDVSAATSARQAADIVRAHLSTAAPEPILTGFGIRDALWPDIPSATLLDEAAARAGRPEAAVALLGADLHCAWLNSAAARALGATIGADGMVREYAFMALAPRLEHVDAATLDSWVAHAARAAAARGVVGLVDFEMDDAISQWRRRAAAGPPAVRVRVGVWHEHLDAAIAQGLRTGDVLPGTGPLVRVGPLKVISDGSLNTRTAFCHDPYPNATGEGAHGVLNVGPRELTSLMSRARAAGLTCAVHAIGDAANTLALDAFAATGARGSIEHAQLLATPDLSRFAALGVVASVQPEHAMDDRDVAEGQWPHSHQRSYPFADLLRAGARLAFGSDAPVAPLDPWIAVSAAVARTRDGRPPWHGSQRLDARAALACSTDGVRLAPGAPADLVVLEHDPLGVDPLALRSMPVAATMADGRWTHAAGDLASALRV